MFKVVFVFLRLSGIPGMIMNDFGNEIEFKWWRVLTLNFE